MARPPGPRLCQHLAQNTEVSSESVLRGRDFANIWPRTSESGQWRPESLQKTISRTSHLRIHRFSKCAGICAWVPRILNLASCRLLYRLKTGRLRTPQTGTLGLRAAHRRSPCPPRGQKRPQAPAEPSSAAKKKASDHRALSSDTAAMPAVNHEHHSKVVCSKLISFVLPLGIPPASERCKFGNGQCA